MLVAALVVSVVVTAPPPPVCSQDSDCVISIFPGCCGACCPLEPFAVARAQDEGSQKICAVASCAAPRCMARMCKEVTRTSAWRAACNAGQCVRLAAQLDSDVCLNDEDCVVTSVSPTCCSPCCPEAPRAVARAVLEQLTAKCNAATCPKPNCGRPSCEHVPSASEVRAVCAAKHCRLADDHQPAASQCARDADCEVAFRADDGGRCCRPAAVRTGSQPQEKPEFGLKPGQPKSRRSCAPCPGAQPSRAVCNAGACALEAAPLTPRPPG